MISRVFLRVLLFIYFFLVSNKFFPVGLGCSHDTEAPICHIVIMISSTIYFFLVSSTCQEYFIFFNTSINHKLFYKNLLGDE